MVVTRCKELNKDVKAKNLLENKDEVVEFVTKAGITTKEMSEHTWFVEENVNLYHATRTPDGMPTGLTIFITQRAIGIAFMVDGIRNVRMPYCELYDDGNVGTWNI